MNKHNNQQFDYKQNVNIILEQLREDIEIIFDKYIVEYIDIVSVDLLNQSDNVSYDVYFFGPEINERYVKFIGDYFDIREKGNKSLLNIKTSGEKIFSGVNLQKTINQSDNKNDNKYWIKDFDLYTTTLTFERDKEEVEEHINEHFGKWTKTLKNYYPNLKHVFFHKRAIDIANNEIAVAAIWIGLNKAIKNDANIRVIETKIQNTLSNHIISSLIPEYLSVIDKQAIKSAIAAIMSRNMSHNLGSHILSYLKNSLSEIPKIWDNNLAEMQKLNEDDKTDFEFVLKLNEKLENKINIIYGNKEDGEAHFLLGLGHFLNYLQERQDFIATIASDFLPYFGTVNFKDFIYDELNRDLKIIRHKKENNSRYKIKNLLLEYIAYSEDFNRDKIKIHFENFDGINNHKNLEELRKINCDLPGGIIGRQAFFSIFENIIRNAAKHGGKKESELRFTILIENFEEYNEFWKVSIVDNNANANNAIKKLRRSLIEKYVDESGKIIETNKGIKEIRISAAWLRSENVANIDEQKMPNGQPSILSIDRVVVEKSDDINAIQTDKKWTFVKDEYDKAGNLIIDESQVTNLAYTFYLRKTQKAVFITDSKISDIFDFNKTETKQENIKKELNNEFEIKTLEEYKKEVNKNFDIIFTDKKLEKEFKKIKLISTSRCFPPVSAKELKSRFNEAKEKVGEKDFIDKVIYDYFYKWIKVSHEKDIAEINTDTQKPYIAIIDKLVDDKNKVKIHPSDTKRMKIFANDTEFFDTPEKSKNQIIFRTHNDSENEFNLLRWQDKDRTIERKEFTNAKFIEGISGHNSSERLIRSVNFTEEWALKITESALTSVLVLDERIFQRLNGESNKLFYKTFDTNQHTEKIENIINTNKTETEKANNLQNYIANTIGLKIDNEIKRIIAFVVDEDFPEDLSNLTNILVSKEKEINIKKENFEKVVYNKKNIHVFNLLEDNKEFIVVDINSEKIGTLSWKNNKLTIERTDYGKNENNFRFEYDFVVTHQGLLDKLYGNMFRQSSGYEDNKINDFKEDLYKNYRNIFVAEHKQIIHSGRSKPDMLPRNTVFNQYSSVESAFFDCKFSLTELLYSARPEKDTWNK